MIAVFCACFQASTFFGSVTVASQAATAIHTDCSPREQELGQEEDTCKGNYTNVLRCFKFWFEVFGFLKNVLLPRLNLERSCLLLDHHAPLFSRLNQKRTTHNFNPFTGVIEEAKQKVCILF
jgi:hypothetical protein